jgi:GNAT superfamily N-acetyltransferase
VETRSAIVYGAAVPDSEPLLRVATLDDRESIDMLMKESAAAHFPRFYEEPGCSSAVRHIAVVDPTLLEDGTYYVLDADGGEVVACGGWSRRGKLYTGSGEAEDDERLIDPVTEPARVRAMFVRDDWSRRGLGRRILEECEAAARREGFRELALMSTLPGLPLYLSYGFVKHEDVDIPLPDGLAVPGATMTKPIEP